MYIKIMNSILSKSYSEDIILCLKRYSKNCLNFVNLNNWIHVEHNLTGHYGLPLWNINDLIVTKYFKIKAENQEKWSITNKTTSPRLHTKAFYIRISLKENTLKNMYWNKCPCLLGPSYFNNLKIISHLV